MWCRWRWLQHFLPENINLWQRVHKICKVHCCLNGGHGALMFSAQPLIITNRLEHNGMNLLLSCPKNGSLHLFFSLRSGNQYYSQVRQHSNYPLVIFLLLDWFYNQLPKHHSVANKSLINAAVMSHGCQISILISWVSIWIVARVQFKMSSQCLDLCVVML